MQSDEDMMAQIANIEAQLSMQGQGGGAPSAASGGWQTSTFGGNTFGGGAQAPQGFPRQPMGQPATAATGTQAHGGHQFSKDTDDRSVFVGNLPKGVNGVTTTPEELSQFFADCGPMLTVTVIRDKATGELKGTAYVEFATHEAAGRAIDTKNNSNFKGSTIIVCWPSSTPVASSNLSYSPFSTPFSVARVMVAVVVVVFHVIPWRDNVADSYISKEHDDIFERANKTKWKNTLSNTVDSTDWRRLNNKCSPT